MNKLDECYVISSEIINKYIELLSLPIYIISNNMKQNKINEIKTLVEEEYKIIHSMSIIEIKLCLEKINTNENNYDSAVLARIRNKIEDYREVLLGDYISSSNLGIKNIPQDKVFSSYEIILSMLNIDTLKSMKKKIYSLTPTCDKDIMFTNSLKRQLDISKITFLFTESSSELISLYNNIDINQIPRINISEIKRNVKNINFDNTIRNVTAIYIKKILDTISNMQRVNNNPNDIFNYLSLITKIEVLISYMDKNMLKTILEYCNGNTNENNRNRMTLVKKLIKERIDNQ